MLETGTEVLRSDKELTELVGIGELGVALQFGDAPSAMRLSF
jgi:hypothetical protein